MDRKVYECNVCDFGPCTLTLRTKWLDDVKEISCPLVIKSDVQNDEGEDVYLGAGPSHFERVAGGNACLRCEGLGVDLYTEDSEYMPGPRGWTGAMNLINEMLENMEKPIDDGPGNKGAPLGAEGFAGMIDRVKKRSGKPIEDVFGRLGDILRPEPLMKSMPCAKCQGSGLVEIDPYGNKTGPMLFDCDRCFGTGVATKDEPYNVNEDHDE